MALDDETTNGLATGVGTVEWGTALSLAHHPI